ncbi:MAG: restriction endonuclease subunit S [Rhodospirillaceae bacterium]
MTGEWRSGTLGDIAKVQSGFAFKSCDMGENGHPVIKIKNINPPDVDISDVLRIPTSVIEANPRIEKFRLDKGDILIAMTGATVGKVGRMPTIAEPHYLNQRVGKVFVTDGNAANEDFVYYVISQDGHVDQMFDLADGSAQANISGKQIESLEIPLPPLPEQKAIAHFLGSLDDKIELNRRMNETLEGMAQALFKSWFVDFDPVIDNALAAGNPIPEPLAQRAETRRQALANGTANRESAQAFPASFRFTEELGWIPEGWEVKSLSDLINIKGGTQPPSSSFRDTPKEGYIRLVQIRDYDTDTHETYIPETSKLRITSPMDIMIGRYGAAVGRILWGLNGAYNVALVKLDFHRDNIREFIRTYLLSNRFQDQMQAISGRSAQSGFNKGDIKSFNLVVPTEPITTLYEDFANPIRVRGLHQNNKSQTLAKLRDVLLPKLISGELRIPQVEKMVEDAIA